MIDLNGKSVFISAAGGQVDYISEDGEVLGSIAVPPGRIPALSFVELCPEGASVQLSDGLTVAQLPSRVGIQPYGEGSHDSGANPDYRPTSASRFEREMRVGLARLQANEKRVEAKIRALSSIERVPMAPVTDPEPGDVIEPASEVKPADAE